MGRRTIDATFKVRSAEFDASEFSDSATVVDLSQRGFYVVEETYVFTGDGYLTDSDGAPLIEEDLMRNPHLETLVFGWED
jgi:hypothetical protein